MKKHLALIVVALMCACCLGLAACGGSSGSSSGASGASDPSASDSASSDSGSSSASDSSASSAQSGSLMRAFLESIDSKGGAHLQYEVREESLGSINTYDVYARNGMYASVCTTKLDDVEQTMITAMINGKVYNLYPSDMHGTLVSDSVPSSVASDPLTLDDLYNNMVLFSRVKEYTVEQRELDGKTYTVEVFSPYTQGSGNAAFYFDDNGNLVHYERGAMESGSGKIGGWTYTVKAIDDKIDPTVFELSAYTIE